MTFSERLQFLLKTKRISIQDLASNLGINISQINMWLNGSATPTKGDLVKLALFLNVKSTYLVGKDVDLLFNDDSHTEKANFDSTAFKNKLNRINEELNPDIRAEKHFKDNIYPEMLIAGLLNNPMMTKMLGFSFEDIDKNHSSEFTKEILRQIELISWKYRKGLTIYNTSSNDEIKINEK